MDAGLRDPFCHPDAQLEVRLRMASLDQEAGGQHQSLSRPHMIPSIVRLTRAWSFNNQQDLFFLFKIPFTVENMGAGSWVDVQL